MYEGREWRRRERGWREGEEDERNRKSRGNDHYFYDLVHVYEERYQLSVMRRRTWWRWDHFEFPKQLWKWRNEGLWKRSEEREQQLNDVA